MAKSIPRPSILDGFGYLGAFGGERRWRSDGGRRLYTWDSLHAEVEVFNARGKHLGALDPITGAWVKPPFPRERSMSSETRFLDLFVAGKVRSDEIDNCVDRWHEAPGGRELHDYLDMTPDEYSLWLRAPDALPYIAKARREMRPLTEIVAGECRKLRRGGRSVAAPNMTCLEDWLKTKGEVI